MEALFMSIFTFRLTRPGLGDFSTVPLKKIQETVEWEGSSIESREFEQDAMTTRRIFV